MLAGASLEKCTGDDYYVIIITIKEDRYVDNKYLYIS